MKKTLVYFPFLLLLLALNSCVSQKKLTYFREVDAHSADSINKTFTSQIDPTIKPGDAMTISVSALDQEAVAPYNLYTPSPVVPGQDQRLTTANSMLCYKVDENGYINFPVLGQLYVLGLKRPEVEELIKGKLEGQVVEPLVIVTLINARVTVLGEVAHPGQYNMNNTRMTLPDALGLAGDMTPYGMRENVLITRETNGKLEFARVNLNSDEIFTSPYYYLQQNDVIYVSPNKVRAINSQGISLWLSMVSTVCSTATVIVTVVNATRK